jgi:hypothetical protein
MLVTFTENCNARLLSLRSRCHGNDEITKASKIDLNEASD